MKSIADKRNETSFLLVKINYLRGFDVQFKQFSG